MRTAFSICAFLFFATVLEAQVETISISLRDTTVEAIINEIRNQTEIDFIFNHEELDKCPKVSVSVSNGSVEEVLNQCLKNTGLTHQKVNNTIIIAPPKNEGKNAPANIRQRKQSIRGTVTDRDSQIPLPFASVVVLNTQPLRGAMTDGNGDFKIDNLPPGRYSLQVSYVGYQDVVLSEILLGSAKEMILAIEITEETQSIGEVSVSLAKGEPLNQMATVSSRSFSVEETKRYAASISDPARMVQVFAGVSGTDDATNEIVIRGNSPNWLLWRLEGVEIPSPNHFAEEGYTSGAVSILSTNMLGTSDFFTGAFPAEYGNALSGVFDIRLRNGNNQEYEYTLQAGVLGIDLSAEGPFKKGYSGSYLFNYRYSSFSLLNSLNVQLSKNALPNYQDLSFKINLPTEKAGVFSVWALGGLSDDNERFLPDTASGELTETGYSDITKTGMYAAGISHIIFPDDRSYIKTVISPSLSFSSENYDRMDSLGMLHDYMFDEFQSRAFRVTSLYNRKFSSRLTARTGVTLNFLNYDYFAEQADSEGILNAFMNSSGHTSLFQGYVQTRYKFSDRIFFTAGLHYAYFALSSDQSLEPRLGFMIKLPKRQKLSIGIGRHSKNANLPVYFVEQENPDGSLAIPNRSLKMIRSTHYIASYDKMVGRDMNLKAEIYYQRISKLPVPLNPEKLWTPAFGGIYPDDTLASIGAGRNIGLELTFQKFFTNGTYFLVTSSLYDSKFKPADGQWYNSRYNSNYINNFVGGKEFKWGENKMVSVNSKIIWAGGKRYIPIDLEESIKQGTGVFNTAEIYSEKAKDYFRLDVGFRLHFYRQKAEHVISLDIQNVTNRRNIWAKEYNPVTESIEDYPMAGIIPLLNYRVEF